MKYRKKPVVIEATRWFKNGDHPLDYSLTHDGFENGELRQFPPEERKANSWEGDIVRYFRHPEVSGESTCKHCGKIMHDHGWIETLEGGHIVCPGDWIITGIEGERYPCKPQIFDQTYEPVAQQPAVEPYEALFTAAMNTAEQAMDYVQSNPDKFDACLGDDKLAIVCREFLKAQQPTPDVSVLVEVLEWYSEHVFGCRKMTSEGERCRAALDRDGGVRARVALALRRKEGKPVSHDWDDQDKCRRCGDRDWYASATCTPTTAEDVSHDNQ